MRIIPSILIGILALSCGACSTMHKFDHSNEYQNVAGDTQAMVMPKGLSSEGIETYYKIPPVAKNAPSGKPSILPPGSKLNKK